MRCSACGLQSASLEKPFVVGFLLLFPAHWETAKTEESWKLVLRQSHPGSPEPFTLYHGRSNKVLQYLQSRIWAASQLQQHSLHPVEGQHGP